MPIGYGATISAPHMHEFALAELIEFVRAGGKVLDVGSGSGYLTTCFAILGAEVIGIDHIPELVDFAKRNIQKNYKGLLDKGQIKLVVGDGRIGYKEEAPYDAIHVGAAIEEIPQELIDQLALGGRMVIPVGPPGNQYIFTVDKTESGDIKKTQHFGVRYVPLTSKKEQWHFE